MVWISYFINYIDKISPITMVQVILTHLGLASLKGATVAGLAALLYYHYGSWLIFLGAYIATLFFVIRPIIARQSSHFLPNLLLLWFVGGSLAILWCEKQGREVNKRKELIEKLEQYEKKYGIL